MFRVSTTPITSTQNCNYSLRYCAATSLQRGQAWQRWREVAAQKNMTSTGSNVANLAWPRWREVAAQKLAWPRCLRHWSAPLARLEGGSCTVPEAVVTVLYTPDDRCGWHPKHVEWTRRTINRLLCVASRWTIINIDQRCTEPKT